MDWFDFRAARAERMRRDGWSWKALSEHFGVPEMIIKNWMPTIQAPKPYLPPALRKPKLHCGYRKTASRNDSMHDARLEAHRDRIRRELSN